MAILYENTSIAVFCGQVAFFTQIIKELSTTLYKKFFFLIQLFLLLINKSTATTTNTTKIFIFFIFKEKIQLLPKLSYKSIQSLY